jgi:hypothetical protein
MLVEPYVDTLLTVEDADAGLTYTWSFEDGGSASGRAVTHCFETVGVTSFTLKVVKSEMDGEEALVSNTQHQVGPRLSIAVVDCIPCLPEAVVYINVDVLYMYMSVNKCVWNWCCLFRESLLLTCDSSYDVAKVLSRYVRREVRSLSETDLSNYLAAANEVIRTYQYRLAVSPGVAYMLIACYLHFEDHMRSCVCLAGVYAQALGWSTQIWLGLHFHPGDRRHLQSARK